MISERECAHCVYKYMSSCDSCMCAWVWLCASPCLHTDTISRTRKHTPHTPHIPHTAHTAHTTHTTCRTKGRQALVDLACFLETGSGGVGLAEPLAACQISEIQFTNPTHRDSARVCVRVCVHVCRGVDRVCVRESVCECEMHACCGCGVVGEWHVVRVLPHNGCKRRV